MRSTLRANSVAARFLLLVLVASAVYAGERPDKDRNLIPGGTPTQTASGTSVLTEGQRLAGTSEPEGSLIQKLEIAPLGDGLAETLKVVQEGRSAPGRRFRVVDTTVANSSNIAVDIEGLVVADWSFQLAERADDPRYQRLDYREDVWYGSTYWTGPDWTRVGKDWHHPGEKTPSVRRFEVPRDGRVTIAGRVFKYHVDGTTDGVRLSIRHGSREVWNAEIAGDDRQGVEPRLTLDVLKGDKLRFVVHKRGTIVCDTTCWDPIIAYPDGETHQASKGFSTSAQGQHGWSYELEADGHLPSGSACIRGFASDSSFRECIPAPGHPVRWSSAEFLPLFVLSDGRDQSGIAVAIPSAVPWQLQAEATGNGTLHLRLSLHNSTGRWPVRAGQPLKLPPFALAPYQGSWPHGMTALQDFMRAEACEEMKEWRQSVGRAINLGALSRTDADRVDLDLWAMVQADWRQQDRLVETPEAYAAATAVHFEKARLLLDEPLLRQQAESLSAEIESLKKLGAVTGRSDLSLDQRRAVYFQVRSLKRRIALANPLMDFGKLIFVKRVPTSYSHLVMQYFGWRARPGGGIFVLERPGRSLSCRDVLGSSFADGNVLEPRLSYDAQRVVFSFVRVPGKQFDPGQLKNDVDEGFYHVYETEVSGAANRQLTRGPYEDLMPTYLPDGGIAFCSTRRRGYARCFGGQFSPRWHVYTLHRMDGDGGNIRALSYHDTNEWFPTVSNTGTVLYSRWDYIDRDAVTHQNVWSTRPDGTNPEAVWGNATPSPHCAFQLQPIPGSDKIIFTASAHHSIAGGSLAILDPAAGHDGPSPITRITPEVPFPEAEGQNITEYYDAPWPLSEKYFLVAYSPRPLVWEPGANLPNALGIYLLDVFGNRELIYRDPEIGSTNPCPIMVRTAPPILAPAAPIATLPKREAGEGMPQLAPASDSRSDHDDTGEFFIADVHQGLGNVARSRIKEIRIVQIFPKTTHVAGSPPIGLAGEENGRAILGTVPVEPDGSARFTVPARRPLLFQALDADGCAYQTMRSVTYVQPGERLSCVGCHENRMAPPGQSREVSMAMRRGPSAIVPGAVGGRPFSFVEMVQPMLDRHCLKCHGGEKTEGKIDLSRVPAGNFSRAYLSLCGDRDFSGAGTNPKNATEALVPRFGARNQIQVTQPGGTYGALGSRLIKLIRAGHYEVQFPVDDFRRLAAWIDLNAIFYGVNSPKDQSRQLRGEPIDMPDVQ